MTVDLSKAKAGDTVHFRCGGSATIKQPIDGDFLWFDGDCQRRAYKTNGQHSMMVAWESPFDIIRIEPAPFDWKDVKPGMCFTVNKVAHGCSDGVKVWYIGPDISFNGFVIVTLKPSSVQLYNVLLFEKEFLDRTPALDHQVSQ